MWHNNNNNNNNDESDAYPTYMPFAVLCTIHFKNTCPNAVKKNENARVYYAHTHCMRTQKRTTGKNPNKFGFALQRTLSVLPPKTEIK